jgi:hypothetical protein
LGGLSHRVPAATGASCGHTVEVGEQVAATLQAPLVPQVRPSTTGVQVPSLLPPASREHAWQSLAPPPHASAQQTLSTQKFEMHWSTLVHELPGPCFSTVTSNDTLAWLPLLSRVTQVTVVVPIGNSEPD